MKQSVLRRLYLKEKKEKYFFAKVIILVVSVILFMISLYALSQNLSYQSSAKETKKGITNVLKQNGVTVSYCTTTRCYKTINNRTYYCTKTNSVDPCTPTKKDVLVETSNTSDSSSKSSNSSADTTKVNQNRVIKCTNKCNGKVGSKWTKCYKSCMNGD